MLKEDFISFPNAEGFPAGPYDLDGISFVTSEDNAFEILVQLGFVYDIYLLRIISADTTSWELWHKDSAVVFVDEKKVADNPVFNYSNFTLSCDFQLRVNLSDRAIEGRAINVTFLQAIPEISFMIEFKLESGIKVGLCGQGWREINYTTSDDSWPSEEWKDWNTM
ncbi:MAG: hypothetical protein U0W24_11780 [Bacteroidales bacterium]